VERFHQTIKRWLARQPPARPIGQLQHQVDRFIAYYSDVRPHRAVGRRPPIVAFGARAKAGPQDRRSGSEPGCGFAGIESIGTGGHAATSDRATSGSS